MKTWLTIRVDSDGAGSCRISASNDVADLNDAKLIHSVVGSVDVELPSEIDAALAQLLKANEEELSKALRRNTVVHLAALAEPKGKKFSANLSETENKEES